MITWSKLAKHKRLGQKGDRTNRSCHKQFDIHSHERFLIQIAPKQGFNLQDYAIMTTIFFTEVQDEESFCKRQKKV